MGYVNSKNMILEAGFDEYLKKPIEFDRLEEVLLKYIEKDKIQAP